MAAEALAALGHPECIEGFVDGLTRAWPQPLREDGDLSRHGQRAAESPDDHTIKLVEASLGEFRRSGRPEFLAVVEHRLGASSS